MNHTCLAFPDEAGTHLPTPEGWKAELALCGWYTLQLELRLSSAGLLVKPETNI